MASLVGLFDGTEQKKNLLSMILFDGTEQKKELTQHDLGVR